MVVDLPDGTVELVRRAVEVHKGFITYASPALEAVLCAIDAQSSEADVG